MFIQQLVKPKKSIKTISEDATLQEAIDLLEEYNFRCIPILDSSKKIYRGNIYKMHIYKHKSEGRDMNLPVTHLIRNATKYIHVDSSFFNTFFMIKDFPYITILDKNNHFYGILTHNSMLRSLQQSWNIDHGGYVLTVEAPGKKDDLTNISKIVNRNSSIMSCVTLDLQKESKVRQFIITLEPGLEQESLNKINTQLSKKGYSIVELKELQN